jgi:NADH:ubiquinone oxidoreductase subunit C
LTKNLLVYQCLKDLRRLCPIIKFQFIKNEIGLIINNTLLTDILFFLKFHCFYQFKILTCISGVDYPENKYRFKIVYELLSIRYNNRLKIKIFVNELKPVYSVIKLFFVAKWYESEIWDMYGIFFSNHLNLVRLLTDYGFEGFPGRKNFPLTGYVESRYNEIKKSVVREIIELNQEYRNFKFLSVWETQNF